VREIRRHEVLPVIDAALAFERRSGPSPNAARQISPCRRLGASADQLVACRADVVTDTKSRGSGSVTA
jgi:hypothetical protein